jgi:hypothetical protein
LGWDTFPCVEVDLPLERERELNVRLNKTTGEFDFDKLANFFDADELTEWGFSDEELFGDEDEEEQELTDLSDQLEASLRIEIGVESENEQQKLYKELTERGYECRILTL